MLYRLLTCLFLSCLFWACGAHTAPVETLANDDGPALVVVPDASAPAGFVEMYVAEVLSTESGPVVVLADPAEGTLLPIWIGTSEAFAIALRLDGRAFERPLTHDLVDALIRELGAELVQVRIDGVQATAYVATLEIRDGERVFLLDSRASDSIALALSHDAPIFVSDRVLMEGGIPLDLLDTAPTNEPPREPKQPTVSL